MSVSHQRKSPARKTSVSIRFRVEDHETAAQAAEALEESFQRFAVKAILKEAANVLPQRDGKLPRAVTIEIASELERNLRAEAARRGLSPEAFASQLIGSALPRSAEEQESVNSAIKGLRQLRKGIRLDGIAIKDLINEGRR